MVIVPVVILAFLVGGYGVLVHRGMVSPPGFLRSNTVFSTLTWTQSAYSGRTTVFRTITVEPDGGYREVVQGRIRSGQVDPGLLSEIRELATSPELAADANKSRNTTLPFCTDSSTIAVAMGELEVRALNCGSLTAKVLPTFDKLSEKIEQLASDISPSGGG